MPFVTYTLQKLLNMALTLVVISLISFATVYALPSDPVSSRYPQLNEQEREAMRDMMGLNDPLPERYFTYMSSLLQGDLGVSYNTGQLVLDDFKARLPASLELALSAFVLAALVGIPLGMLAATWQNSWIDHLTRLLAVTALSVPVFWLGILLIYLFFYEWQLVPPPMGRIGLSTDTPEPLTGLLLVDTLLHGDMDTFREALWHLALPAFTLALSIIAPIMRITRSAMIGTLRQEFTRTNRALGLPERAVVGDALHNALLPILTICGYLVTVIVAGAALVEQVFSWPGIGIYAIRAVVTTDYAVVQSFLLVIGLLVVTVNFVIDMLYAMIDPRVRYGSS